MTASGLGAEGPVCRDPISQFALGLNKSSMGGWVLLGIFLKIRAFDHNAHVHVSLLVSASLAYAADATHQPSMRMPSALLHSGLRGLAPGGIVVL